MSTCKRKRISTEESRMESGVYLQWSAMSSASRYERYRITDRVSAAFRYFFFRSEIWVKCGSFRFLVNQKRNFSIFWQYKYGL
uniref:Uncharacterized protein n=1 Tax=Ascaris lumbricoides TaxID=6252 RepID=A0A0M3IAC1_ASCLU